MKAMRGLQFLPDNATYDVMNSPVGKLTIITSPEGLHAILWDNDHKEVNKISSLFRQSRNEQTIIETKKQLQEYFAGKRKKFDLPLVINGTDFQIQCWQQLLKIPYGKTVSYGEQAEKVGNKNKARAVGMANGLNPISIVVPCHRVIGSSGQLIGFGGGLDKKVYLLELEQK
jgi:methylated-DNA-[protein]-cysteine S-methyltransferase